MFASQGALQTNIGRVLDLQRDQKISPTADKLVPEVEVRLHVAQLRLKVSLLGNNGPERFIVTFDVRCGGENGIRAGTVSGLR
ncbi:MULTISPECIES: hypothetical protein [Burkholderia]|uniref:hypothetical protein n=1 Tax=Burkholderia TaxID=32008 RepID=UPI0012F4BBBB|nr:MULTISPECIES: hypothetical protein [Burkholderia]UEC05452.1 hypothetical protein LK462_35180 [Burkholderia vietnamiensis]